MNQIANPQVVAGTNPWVCVFSVMLAGALGGLLNANISDNGFALPRRIRGIWCPGALWNVFVGGLSALTSWALYGSGSVIEVAGTQREQISLKLGALAGALIVGMAGSKWLTGEVDKNLMKQSVMEVAKQNLPSAECKDLEDCGSPRQLLKTVAGS
jgi:hypothetical protein